MILSRLEDVETSGVCPLPDWELWSCALTVERGYGAYASAHIAERIGALGKAGDWNGVATWKAIAARLGLLHANGSKQ